MEINGMLNFCCLKHDYLCCLKSNGNDSEMLSHYFTTIIDLNHTLRLKFG
jgi:hypothetical protein